MGLKVKDKCGGKREYRNSLLTVQHNSAVVIKYFFAVSL